MDYRTFCDGEMRVEREDLEHFLSVTYLGEDLSYSLLLQSADGSVAGVACKDLDVHLSAEDPGAMSRILKIARDHGLRWVPRRLENCRFVSPEGARLSIEWGLTRDTIDETRDQSRPIDIAEIQARDSWP